MDEIKQSLRIIDQCLHQMPDGPIMAKLPRLLRPRPGRAYAGIEGPRGQYAAYVISDGTDQPFRMRIHDPSFIHLQAVGLMMPGHLIADTMAVMASPRPDHGRSGQVTPRRVGRPMRRCRARSLTHLGVRSLRAHRAFASLAHDARQSMTVIAAGRLTLPGRSSSRSSRCCSR